MTYVDARFFMTQMRGIQSFSFLFPQNNPHPVLAAWLHVLQGPIVQSPISANPGLTPQVLLHVRVNRGLALIGL